LRPKSIFGFWDDKTMNLDAMPETLFRQKILEKSPFSSLFWVIVLAGIFSLLFTQTPIVSSDSIPGSGDGASAKVSLCDWQRDYDFFTGTSEEVDVAETVPCEAVFHLAVTPTAPQSTAEIPSTDKAAFESELRLLVAGYPIEAMVPAIAEYDREIAGLIVGIGKKESNWGKRVPRTDSGEDCFNYWGYKGAGVRGIAMGHGCFGDPAEAVHAIGNRLRELVALRQTSEPARLVIWKCGSSCATHSPESVKKWIADVDMYYREIAKK
jgi:hypothetical protein